MVSKNGVAVLVWAIWFIMQALGIELEPGSAERYAEAIVVVLGLALAIWNQLDRADISWFIWKK